MVRFRKSLPEDFELTCTYTTTGGTTYKSVTFRFDQASDRSYDNFVYTSAHAPGPKVQVAYTRNGRTSYPSNGSVARAIEIGKQYTLRFAVRDNLINVWLDDEFVLAYQLPDRRDDGFLSISGFDATVEFDEIGIRSLPSTFTMEEAGSKPSSANPEQELRISEADLKLAIAERDALLASFAADTARYTSNSTGNSEELIRKASIAQAEEKVARALLEQLLAGTDMKKLKTTETNLNKAEAELSAAKNGERDYQTVKVTQKALETPAHSNDSYPAVYASESTGRRLAFANWITSKDNPLTARVAVNHIWLRHFGTPLVESVFDFGLRAPEPTHAELLDYLARELIDSGWSMKHIHRLIVTSKAYQLSSSTRNADHVTVQLDANNVYYWHMNSRRMEAQVIRDSLLSLAGRLDLTLGGPSLEINSSRQRRSIYYKHSRDQQHKFLSIFDDADFLQCYRREESVVPQQALALANSSLSLSSASVDIAAQIQAEHPEEFINQSFMLLLARPATELEQETCLDYFRRLKELNSDIQQSVIRARLIHVLINHNDFITIR